MENNNTGFFRTYHDDKSGWMLKNHPVKMLRGTEVETNDKEYNRTPGIQKVFTDTSYNTAKSMNDMKKVLFRDFSRKTGYYNRKLTKGCMSGRDKYIKNELDNEGIRILNLDTENKTKIKGKGTEKFFI